MRLLTTALEGLHTEGVSITDSEGRYVYANSAHAQILGYAPSDLQNLDPAAFRMDRADPEELETFFADPEQK